MASPFLDDLPGIRDLQYADGQPVPRRALLAFFGSLTVVDNPAADATDITFTGPPTSSTLTLNISADVDMAPVTASTIGTATVLRLNPSHSMSMYGLSASALPRLTLMNVSSYDLTIQHESTSSTDSTTRIICPGAAAHVLSSGDSVELVRDPVSARWRLVL